MTNIGWAPRTWHTKSSGSTAGGAETILENGLSSRRHALTRGRKAPHFDLLDMGVQIDEIMTLLHHEIQGVSLYEVIQVVRSNATGQYQVTRPGAEEVKRHTPFKVLALRVEQSKDTYGRCPGMGNFVFQERRCLSGGF